MYDESSCISIEGDVWVNEECVSSWNEWMSEWSLKTTNPKPRRGDGADICNLGLNLHCCHHITWTTLPNCQQELVTHCRQKGRAGVPNMTQRNAQTAVKRKQKQKNCPCFFYTGWFIVLCCEFYNGSHTSLALTVEYKLTLIRRLNNQWLLHI